MHRLHYAGLCVCVRARVRLSALACTAVEGTCIVFDCWVNRTSEHAQSVEEKGSLQEGSVVEEGVQKPSCIVHTYRCTYPCTPGPLFRGRHFFFFVAE